MDAISLVVNALTSGAAQGITGTVSDAVTSAYAKLKRLVSAKFAGNGSAEVALAEHASDPETWQVPLTKYLTSSGTDADEATSRRPSSCWRCSVRPGTAQGKYRVDLRGPQGVQVGDGNQQYNTFNVPAYVMAAPAGRDPARPAEERAGLRPRLRGGGRASTPGPSARRGLRGRPWLGAAIRRRQQRQAGGDLCPLRTVGRRG